MLTPISPIEPVAPWLGGKHRLAATLAERIARIPHRTYAEPFVGMGGVFFRRAAKPPAEVVNDIDGEIINLFRILQRHYPQFIDVLRFQVTSRAEFLRLRAVPAETLTDLERAARFLYIQRLAFGGQKRGVFGVAPDRPARFDLSTLEPMLAEAHERLGGVTFEQLDWPEFIRRYDRPETLFYLDPPYFGGEADYGRSVRSAEAGAASRRAMRSGRITTGTPGARGRRAWRRRASFRHARTRGRARSRSVGALAH